ncbi:MAG: MgtC/SapB family protein [Gammaproteobacteria bacterium]|jgi:putative Mg2+ transporter-C (MgtC) family protein
MEISLLIQILVAFVIGAIIGLERDFHGSPAGVRTYAAVCLGACVFGLISTHAQGAHYYQSVADPTRIAAQIVTGIGFLGAGVIFRTGVTTVGLTTAATIWATAAVGLSIAFRLYSVAIFAAVLIVVTLALNELPLWENFKNKIKKRRIEYMKSKE